MAAPNKSDTKAIGQIPNKAPKPSVAILNLVLTEAKLSWETKKNLFSLAGITAVY